MSQFPPDYPIEYVEWKVRFFGREFIVTPDVLIPRLETESLVRHARQILQKNKNDTPIYRRNGESEGATLSERRWKQRIDERQQSESEFVDPSGAFGTFQSWKVRKDSKKKTIVVDIGCGSGIIGTSVADLADEVIFLDISPAALAIAERNFRTHFPEKQAQFIVSDLLSHIPRFQDSNILYLTNLPYIKADDWEHMSPDTRHEPRLALFGGESTGFELYERLFEQLSALAPLIRGGGGFARWRCLFEFGFDQREIAETDLKKYPQWEYSFFADYAGVERFGEISL